MTDHSPYLTLGVDFGAPPAQVRRAFARAAKRARKDPLSPLRVEELNHALHLIDAAAGDPADRVGVYRVPADPGVLATSGPGLLAPDAIPAPRTTDPVRDADLLAAAAAEIDRLVDRAVAAGFRPDHGWLETSTTTEGEDPR